MGKVEIVIALLDGFNEYLDMDGIVEGMAFFGTDFDGFLESCEVGTAFGNKLGANDTGERVE